MEGQPMTATVDRIEPDTYSTQHAVGTARVGIRVQGYWYPSTITPRETTVARNFWRKTRRNLGGAAHLITVSPDEFQDARPEYRRDAFGP
jgi:hypothetical protein